MSEEMPTVVVPDDALAATEEQHGDQDEEEIHAEEETQAEVDQGSEEVAGEPPATMEVVDDAGGQASLQSITAVQEDGKPEVRNAFERTRRLLYFPFFSGFPNRARGRGRNGDLGGRGCSGNRG